MAIDKSLRQHYQNGEKVGWKKGMEIIWPEVKKQIKKRHIDPLIDTTTGEIDKSEVAKTLGKSYLKKAAAKKLGVASLNPLVGLLSLVMPWIKQKWGEGGSFQSFTSGIMGPEWADLGSRELRQLEKRREYMLKRKADKKTYSKKNLEEVTNQIKEIKKTRNVIEEVTADDPFAWPEPKDSPISQFPGEDEIIQRQRKEESDAMVAKEIAAAEAFKADIEKQRILKEQAAAYAAEQAAAAAPPQITITQPTGGQGGIQDIGGGGGQPQTGGGGYERGDYGGRGYHWKKGGRVDKALGGRSRDI